MTVTPSGFSFGSSSRTGERLDPAQRWVLRELAHLPGCTVWFVRKRDDGRIGWAVFGSGRREEAMTEADYRRRLRCWWDNQPSQASGAHRGELAASEIAW